MNETRNILLHIDILLKEINDNESKEDLTFRINMLLERLFYMIEEQEEKAKRESEQAEQNKKILQDILKNNNLSIL